MPIALEHLPADVLGLGALAREALAADPTPRGLRAPWIPHRASDIAAPTERFDADDRRELVEAWEQHLAPLTPPVASLDSLRSLALPGASIVLVEASPGLFGGRLEGLWRALHAVRLAGELRDRLDAPVVPVLWNRTETAVATPSQAFQNENLDLRRVALSSAGDPVFPSRRVLGVEQHGLGALRALVQSLVRRGPNDEELLELCCPRHGETQAGAFSRAACGLFGPLGLVVLEPDWIRNRLSRTLAEILGEDPASALDADAARLAELGYELAVDPRDAALVVRRDRPEGSPLHLGGDGFRYEKEAGSRTSAELAAEVVQSPEEFVAGPLLQPLVQAASLPLAAQIGGWEELARQGQTASLRAERGVPDVPFVPRLSATLVEPECAQALTRLGLEVRDVLGGALDQLVADDRPVAAAERLRAISRHTAEELRDAREELSAVDRGLAGQLKRTVAQVRGEIDALAERAERVERNRRGKDLRHVRRLRNTLLPDGRPQEEVLGVLAFVARHGRDALRTLLEELEPLPTEHCVVRVDDAP